MLKPFFFSGLPCLLPYLWVMIFRFVLFLVLLFLAIRFVMRFLMPIMKMTRMTHHHMNDMRKKMEEMQGKQPNDHQPKRVEGDYIDYEEVK